VFQNIFSRILLSKSSLTYFKYILSYIIEQEFINMFQNIFFLILLNKGLLTCFKIYSLVYY